MNSKLVRAVPVLLLLAASAVAQEKAPPPPGLPPPPRKASTPLKLVVVFSRYQGEKKVSNVPYTITFNSDDRPARIRMGVQVPIQTTANNVPTTQYRDVGNNLDINANEVDDGRFKLSCTFEQSSISGDAVPPVLRTFKSEANLTMRDGQTVQYTAATDPVSGDVLKIDVTLTVVK